MIETWLPLLDSLKLTKAEEAVIKKFKQDPLGRTFLPVADILRSHKKADESVELLIQGVERYPSFSVARVALARELLNKGMVEEAWRTLEESPVSLSDNVLAQRLQFKLAVLLGMESYANSVFKYIEMHNMFDDDIKAYKIQKQTSGFEVARKTLLDNLKIKDFDLEQKQEDVKDNTNKTATSEAISEQQSQYTGDNALAGFQVMSLAEVFNNNQANAPKKAGASKPGSSDLDSTTLADIYAKQGHYSKALAIYRRLLRESPEKSEYRNQVAELSQLQKEQKMEDLSIDPVIVDQMETLEILDRQIDFLNELMGKLR